MKQANKLLLILTIICFYRVDVACAQKEGQQVIDSLVAELHKQDEDTGKVKILNELSYHYHPINPDEGIKYGMQGLELATKLEWQQGIGRSNVVLGNNYLRKSNNPEALKHYRQALKIYEKLNYKKGIASVTSNIGLIYFAENYHDKALENFLQSLKIQEEIGNKDGIGIACDNIGDVMKSRNDNAAALKYYLKALVINKELKKQTGVALVTQSIGDVYVLQKNYEIGVACLLKAVEIDAQIGDKLGVASGLTNIGTAYVAIMNDTVGSQGRPTTDTGASSHLPAPVHIPERPHLLDSAISYLQQGLTKGMEIHAMDVMRSCYRGLSDAYRLKAEYKKARDYYVAYADIKDSMSTKENSEKIVRIEYENTRYYDSIRAEQEQKITGVRIKNQKTYAYIGLGIIALLSGFIFFIVKERGKSEKLLLNILPGSVAADIKTKGSTAARQYENATVLFTDFVNFTSASENMSAQELIDELDICFKAFDEITARYGLEKIKTIGDAYLAVAGLPGEDKYHAEHVVAAANEIITFIRDRQQQINLRTFEIRIGINSGSVVAGVVGARKFAYDIWGSTVQLAERLQELSGPGKINISETTYALVKHMYNCKYHDTLPLRNGEHLKMYFVEV